MLRGVSLLFYHDAFPQPIFITVTVGQNPWLETRIMSLGDDEGSKWNVNVCHLCAESEAASLGDLLSQNPTVNINIFASLATRQDSHYCHSLGAAPLKGGPCINIYVVRCRSEHEINNSHAFGFLFTS